MYGPFGLELAKIHIEGLVAEALRHKSNGPARWRRGLARLLIAAGARLGRVRVLPVPQGVERGKA
jgi:hypothetical protein